MSNVSFLLVYVDDVATSEGFYASHPRPPGGRSPPPTFAMLPAGPGLMLGLWKRDGVKPPATSGGGGEIAFTAENDAEVDALCAEWRAKGVDDRATRRPDGFRLHLRRARSRRPAPARLRAGGRLKRPSQAFEQRRREIALGEGRDDDDDRLAGVFRPASDVDRRGDRRARGDADRDAFEPRDEPRGVEGGLVADGDDSRRSRSRSRIAGTKPAPMPWILCGPGAPPDRTGESSGSTAIIRTLGLRALQHLADAGDRSAGADAGDDDVDLAVGVVPDFLGRRAAMDLRDWPDFRTAAA